MHLLIPYIQIRDHDDPLFAEYTYGDSGTRARKLKDLKKGDYVFFHTTVSGRKCITAYYVVDRCLDTIEACEDKTIPEKYENPHIQECRQDIRPAHGEEDVVLFGDPITSRVLDHPLAFDRTLASKLSLGIRFSSKRRDSQTIGSATRSWRKLNCKDVDVLLCAVESAANQPRRDTLRSSEEVAEMLERHVEDHLAATPSLVGDVVGKDLKFLRRQRSLADGKERIDLLYEDPQRNWIVVEVKVGQLGQDALRQIKNYVRDLRSLKPRRKVTGVLVGSGVMPAFETELRKQSKIKIMVYGWKMHVQPW